MISGFFNLTSTDFFIQTIILLIVYLISVPFAGFFSAWFNNLLGDDTAKTNGFLTLNPVKHFNLTGILTLLFLRVGFSRMIPIDPYNIRKPNRKLKVFLAYISEGLGFFLIGLAALFLMILLYGMGSLVVSLKSIMPHISSTHLSVIYLLQGLVFFSFFTSVLNIIWGLVRAFMLIGSEERHGYVDTVEPIMPFVPIIIILFLRLNFVASAIFKFIIILAVLMSYILGY